MFMSVFSDLQQMVILLLHPLQVEVTVERSLLQKSSKIRRAQQVAVLQATGSEWVFMTYTALSSPPSFPPSRDKSHNSSCDRGGRSLQLGVSLLQHTVLTILCLMRRILSSTLKTLK